MPRPPARFQLPLAEQAELGARLRQATMAPRLRVRLQCVQLRNQGWAVPQLAEQLAVSEATVRRALRRVVAGGLDALADRPRSGRPPRLNDQDLDAVEELLRQAAPAGAGLDDGRAGRVAGPLPWRADRPRAAGRAAASAGLALGTTSPSAW